MQVLKNNNPIPSFTEIDRVCDAIVFQIKQRSAHYTDRDVVNGNVMSARDWHNRHVNISLAYAVGIEKRGFGVSYVFIPSNHDALLRELANADYEAYKASLS